MTCSESKKSRLVPKSKQKNPGSSTNNHQAIITIFATSHTGLKPSLTLTRITSRRTASSTRPGFDTPDKKRKFSFSQKQTKFKFHQCSPETENKTTKPGHKKLLEKSYNIAGCKQKLSILVALNFQCSLWLLIGVCKAIEAVAGGDGGGGGRGRRGGGCAFLVDQDEVDLALAVAEQGSGVVVGAVAKGVGAVGGAGVERLVQLKQKQTMNVDSNGGSDHPGLVEVWTTLDLALRLS